MPTMITLVDTTVPVASDFNSNFTALNQVCGTGTTITGYTTGDTLYSSAGATLSKLAIGAARRILGSTGSIPEWVQHWLNVNTTAVGNVGAAGPDDLMTYSLPAATLGANGEGIIAIHWGTAADNVNAKTVTSNFGATATLTQALTANAAQVWAIINVILRTGAATQESLAFMFQGGGTALTDTERTTPGETLSGAVDVKCQATASTADNDIVQTGMVVLFVNGG